MTLDERLAFLHQAERDPVDRALFLAAIDDPLTGDAFWINSCCFTYDPRKFWNPRTESLEPVGYVPFLLWPAQEKAANEIGRAMDNEKNVGGEKSRDMGMTWIILACILKRFLRQRGFSALLGAIRDTLLDDDKNPATLFWKIDCMMQHLPSFLMPGGYKWDYFKKKFRSPADMINPENGNTINGAAPTERFGVGDRKSVIYFDDWSVWEYGAEAWESSSASTNCRIASWTARGLNHAYELRYSKGRFENVRVKIVNIHWSTDPRKQRVAIDPYSGAEYNVWLREQIGDPEAIDPETGQKGIHGEISMNKFLQDYEMKYELGESKAIYAQQVARARTGKFDYDDQFGLYTSWDYGRTNRTAIIFAQFDHKKGRLRLVAYQEHSGEDITFYPPLVIGRDEGTTELPFDYNRAQLEHIERVTNWQKYDPRSGNYKVPYRDHYGDPTGKNKTLTDKLSVVEKLDEAGITITSRRDKDGWHITDRVEDARWLLSLCDIDETACALLIERLNRYKWKDDEKTPIHDVNSDGATAFEYLAVNIRPLIEDWYKGKRDHFETKKVQYATFDGLTPDQREAERQRMKLLRKAQRELYPQEESGKVWTLGGEPVIGGNRPGGGYTDDW